MKHTAFFINEFPVPSETFVLTEIDALLKQGHPVTLFCFKYLKNEVVLPEGLKVLSIAEVSTKEVAVYCAQRSIRLAKAWQLALELDAISAQSLLYHGAKLAYLLKKHQCQHIHCHFMHSGLAYSMIAACWANIPVSSIGHGHDVYINQQNLETKLRRCSFNVAVCGDMEAHFAGLGGQKTNLLHCGVNIERFEFAHKPMSQEKKLLFVGRLVEKKGLTYALSALANLPHDIRPALDIVGEGPLKATLMKQAEQLRINDHVRFLGYQTPAWISQIGLHYHGFLAPFCIADNGDCDTGPVVLKEAMAMGLPVITTNIMGCPEIATANTGFLVEQKNVTQLVKAITAFCQLPTPSYLSMRQQARQQVEQCFNAQLQGAKLSQWIEQARV